MNKERIENNVDMKLDLEVYFEWLINHLNRCGKENVKGYFSNDLNWYNKLNISEEIRNKAELLPIIFHVIEKYTFENYSDYIKDKNNICFYLKYNNCYFCIGDSGNGVYFSFLINPDVNRKKFIDCKEIINNDVDRMNFKKSKLD